VTLFLKTCKKSLDLIDPAKRKTMIVLWADDNPLATKIQQSAPGEDRSDVAFGSGFLACTSQENFCFPLDLRSYAHK
jgi:hypothetical protein